MEHKRQMVMDAEARAGKKKTHVRRSNEVRTAETRKALIEATIQCLCDYGFSRTTTLEISRHANITPGALQHHFGKKDELVLSALDTLMIEMSDVLDKFKRTSGETVDPAGAFIEILWREFYGQPRYLAVWEIAIGSRGEPELYERVLEHRKNSIEKCKEVWLSALNIKSADTSHQDQVLKFILTFLRGSAMLRPISKDNEDLEYSLQMLKDFARSHAKSP